jgi:hypothetical protein
MTTPFWSNEPTILFNKKDILQLWPTENMSFETKLNAITRVVLLLSLLGFLFTRNINLLIIGTITIGIIYSLYKLRKHQLVSSLAKSEGFKINRDYLKQLSTANENKNDDVDILVNELGGNTTELSNILSSDFHPTSYKNPMGNVLLTDIHDSPDRLAAAPSFNPNVGEDIMKAVKKQTQMLNPSIKNTNSQLYGDLKDNYDLDQSMMRFYSTANSRVTNDQGAFGEWLYGSMPSAKESGPDAAAQRVKDNERYILI